MLIKQDQSLIKREGMIPGLRYLLQPGDLRELLLSRADIKDPGELRPGYLRYKPGMNCIARFAFRVDGKPCFAYAKAFSTDAGLKLQKAREQAQCASPLGPGRIILQSEQIMFSVFPNDSKLRSLARLQDKDAREKLVARLFKSHAGWEGADFLPLNYKPERRFVARFRNQAGVSATVKFYSRAEFAKVREYRKHLADTAGVRIPEWIGGSKACQAMAFSWLPGSILREHLAAPGLAAVTDAGKTIARFHLGEQPRLEQRKPEHCAASLGALAQDLGMVLPELDAPARELARKLGAWWLRQPDPALPIHGDFYDKQVVVGDHGVALIDSDSAHLGNPLSDIACFIAHLERHAGAQPPGGDTVRAGAGALIDGYRQLRPEINLRHLRQHIALCLFQLIHNPFRDRVADWPGQTHALLQRCAFLFQSG